MASLLTSVPALLLQGDAGDAIGVLFGGMAMMVTLLMLAIVIIGWWKVFVKAGQPGWAVLIPIFNVYILLKIAGKPGWWLLLFLIPVVNVVVGAILSIDVARAFGQSTAFGLILLFLLGGIGYLILGFGNYRYVGPASPTST